MIGVAAIPRWQQIVMAVNVMSTSTAGSPQAFATRSIASVVSPEPSPLESSTSPDADAEVHHLLHVLVVGDLGPDRVQQLRGRRSGVSSAPGCTADRRSTNRTAIIGAEEPSVARRPG